MLLNSFNADYDLDDVTYGSDTMSSEFADKLR